MNLQGAMHTIRPIDQSLIDASQSPLVNKLYIKKFGLISLRSHCQRIPHRIPHLSTSLGGVRTADQWQRPGCPPHSSCLPGSSSSSHSRRPAGPEKSRTSDLNEKLFRIKIQVLFLFTFFSCFPSLICLRRSHLSSTGFSATGSACKGNRETIKLIWRRLFRHLI